MARPAFRVEPNGPSSFRLFGELDLASAPMFEDAVSPALRDGAELTLDLSNLAFLDSIGVRALFSVADAAGARGGEVVLANPTRTVANTLALVRAQDWPHLTILERTVDRSGG
jgi:anti-anti-sigma factor